MGIVVDDLVGLNSTAIRDMPVVKDAAHAQALLAAGPGVPLSIAGLRHSQGGHTMVADGRMLLSMPQLNRIGTPWQAPAGLPHSALIDVEAGASWDELHRVLGYYSLAPMVQQSSASFSIGGSISVNCHSRDPRWGPISNTVESLTILTGKGDLLTASRSILPDLFHAVIGGYGCCGLILSATLRVVPNVYLEYVGDSSRRSAADYADHCTNLPPETHLSYAWLCCVQGRFYDEALIYDLKHQPMPNPVQLLRPIEQEWGASELMRAGWAAARDDRGATRAMVWDELRSLHLGGPDDQSVQGKGFVQTRLDWLRASVDFTSYRGEASTEILQEYFVAPDKLDAMIRALKRIYEASTEVNVLSTTLRYVSRDAETVLSYCAAGECVCIAVDMQVLTTGAAGSRALSADVEAVLEGSIAAAVALGGSWYLPYANIADRAAFQAAYPRHGEVQATIDRYNPADKGVHRYWNTFLARNFD